MRRPTHRTPGWAPPVKLNNPLTAILLLVILATLVSCSGPRATSSRVSPGVDVVKGELPQVRYYITITPEQVKAAQFAQDCLPAENDPSGNWGAQWEGLQLSIRLRKEVFTNGEPILAAVTLRNGGDRVRYFNIFIPREEMDTKILLTRDGQRILGVDDPKPGESFQQRLHRIRQGSSHNEPLLPGTQRQFFRELSKMFDLTAAGSYSARAERPVVAIDKMPNRPGYIMGRGTNLLSGTVTFRVIDPHGAR